MANWKIISKMYEEKKKRDGGNYIEERAIACSDAFCWLNEYMEKNRPKNRKREEFGRES